MDLFSVASPAVIVLIFCESLPTVRTPFDINNRSSRTKELLKKKTKKASKINYSHSSRVFIVNFIGNKFYAFF